MKNNLLLLIKYTRDFMVFSGMKIVRLILYSALTGFTQGVGVLMLIPLLTAAGVGEFAKSQSRGNRIPEFILEAFREFGLPLNLFTVLTVFVGIIALIRFIQYQQNILTVDTRNSYISNMQSRLFRAVIFAEWRFIAAQRSSNLTQVITTDLPVVSNGTYFFLKFLTDLVLSSVYVVWAMFISVELTGFTLLVAALSFIFLKFCLPHSVKSGVFARESRTQIYSLLLDHLWGLKIAKGYGAEQREYDRFKAIAGEMSRTQTSLTRLNSRIKISYALITNIMLGIFLYLAIRLLETPPAALLLLIVIFSRLLPNLSSFQNDIQQLFSMLPSFEAAETLLSWAGKHRENLVSAETVPPLQLTRSLEIQNLSFSYAAGEGFGLSKLNLEIPVLKTTAVIGESGAGKSTFADILSGILKPDSGGLVADGIEINRGNLLRWRQLVGYLPQDIFLFHDTVRNNILWGKPGASEEEIAETLQLASAADFVSRLPEGLDTVVEDRGSRLSGGERQRIALARTLIRKPQLLILDEATSSLDLENESRIYDSIARLHGKMTIIFITHRLETLKFADKTINLSELTRPTSRS
ncbi:MAG: ABC transporter ATP-binding protein [Victivallaceae bacterium]|nr:ABC transporter ATP-binding protein [Victivallaceae bacterium]